MNNSNQNNTDTLSINEQVGNDALDMLFFKARTHNAWLERDVSDDLLNRLYEIMKWGPTSANSCPARIIFLRTPEAKECPITC